MFENSEEGIKKALEEGKVVLKMSAEYQNGATVTSWRLADPTEQDISRMLDSILKFMTPTEIMNIVNGTPMVMYS